MKKSNGRVGRTGKVASEKKGTQEKLINVAIDLFAANGFKGTSIRDIANRVGMTISNIYYYFGSKEGLLMAILEESTAHIVEKLREVADSDLEPLERFKLLLTTHLRLFVDVYRKESKILFLEEENLTRLSRQYQLGILDIYRKELLGLKQLGVLHYDNLTILTFGIIGVLNWHLRWYRPDGRMSLEQISDEMLTFVLHGALAPPKAETEDPNAVPQVHHRRL